MKERLIAKFEEYKKSVYSPELGAQQEKEVQQAFYAGSFETLNMLIESLGKDESTLETEIHELYAFFHQYSQQQMNEEVTQQDFAHVIAKPLTGNIARDKYE